MSMELLIQPVYHFGDAEEPNYITKEFSSCGLLAGMNAETIGERLARLRKAADLTQKTLASRVGMTQGAIGNIETGTRGYGDSVVALACVLKTSPEYLLLKTDNPATRACPTTDITKEAQRELDLRPAHKAELPMSPEAQHLARWFDRLPADSVEKLKVTQACLQLIAQALSEAEAAMPKNQPSRAPNQTAQGQKQAA